MHGIGARECHRHHGMAHLVMRDDAALARIEHAVFLLQPEHHAINCFFQVPHFHLIAAPAHGQQRRFIDNIGEIRSDHSRRALRDDFEVRIG